MRIAAAMGLTAVMSLWPMAHSPVAAQRPSSPISEPSPGPVAEVLARAASYVSSWQAQFSQVLVEERLTQQTMFSRSEGSQTTRADMLLMPQAECGASMTVRDVFEVNGRAVRDHDERLRKLWAEAPADAMKNAARVADESSRYNIGSTIRNIDVPAFGVTLLSDACQARFAFTKRSEEMLADRPVWRLEFRERQRPTLVRTLRGASVPLEGSAWIEPETGRVLQTLVKIEGTPDGLGEQRILRPRATGETLLWVRVTYSQDEPLALLVPATMDEVAIAADASMVRALATYSNLRKFQVNTTETFK